MQGCPSGERLGHTHTDNAGSNNTRIETTMGTLSLVFDGKTRGSVAIDLTGRRFGRLTAIKRAGSNERGKAMWACLCDCGNAAVTSDTS
jgi:hypothetical protein